MKGGDELTRSPARLSYCPKAYELPVVGLSVRILLSPSNLSSLPQHTGLMSYLVNMLTINQALGTAAVTIVSIAIWLCVQSSRWMTIRRCVGTFAYIRHLHPQLFELKVAVGNFGLAPFKVSKHILLSDEECDQALKKGAERIDFTNKKCVVSRVDSNTFGANPVCEDRYAVDVVSKDALVALQQEGKKSLWERWAQTHQVSQSDTAAEDNLFMFSVFDGHGNVQGHLVADLLTRVLHPSIAQALAGVKSWTNGKISNVIADA